MADSADPATSGRIFRTLAVSRPAWLVVTPSTGHGNRPGRSFMRASRLRLMVALLLAVPGTVISLCPSSATAAETLELAVKAAYLFKLAPFVEWPGSAFAGPSTSFNLCVAGNDPFDGLLDTASSGQRFGERPIVILRLNAVSPSAHCQMVYVAGDPAFVTEVLTSVRGLPVLTVTDGTPGGARGIVNFVIRDNHVRFQIDREAAARNGLQISSKLLSIAVTDEPDRNEP